MPWEVFRPAVSLKEGNDFVTVIFVRVQMSGVGDFGEGALYGGVNAQGVLDMLSHGGGIFQSSTYARKPCKKLATTANYWPMKMAERRA